MNLKTRERPLTRNRIEGLQIETGGSVILSPFADSIPDDCQPSNTKALTVFGGAIAMILIGTVIGWTVSGHFAQTAKDKAELATMNAEFILKKNQVEIDNFCKANSSLLKE